MQHGSVAAAVLPQTRDDGFRRAATMDAEGALPMLTGRSERAFKDLALDVRVLPMGRRAVQPISPI